MENTSTLSRYWIPRSNMGELEARLEKLNKRGRKLGMQPIALSPTGAEEIREVQWDDNRKVKVRYIEVELRGETPKLAGWTFVATLQRLAGDSGEAVTIIRSVPGQELPEIYRSASQVCDHCQTSRIRRDTYVVRSVEGEHKQVGSSCLKDFLGHENPHQLAAWAELLGAFHHQLSDSEEFGFDGHMGREGEWPLEDYLVVAALVCRVSGWVSRKRASEDERAVATADTCDALTFVWRRLSSEDQRDFRIKYGTDQSDEHGIRTGVTFGTEADKLMAEQALDWVRSFRERSGLSDYEHNLLALATVGSVPMRATGIAASIVGSYLRHTDQLRARAAKSNEWISQPGERLELELKVVSVTGYEGQFGTGDRISFEDAQGNSFVWFTASNPGFEAGEALLKLKFTVKGHKEYQGRKQTAITRVAEAKAKAPRQKRERLGPAFQFTAEPGPLEPGCAASYRVSLEGRELGRVQRWPSDSSMGEWCYSQVAGAEEHERGRCRSRGDAANMCKVIGERIAARAESTAPSF